MAGTGDGAGAGVSEKAVWLGQGDGAGAGVRQAGESQGKASQVQVPERNVEGSSSKLQTWGPYKQISKPRSAP